MNALRRTAAFGLDISIANTASQLITNAIVQPMPNSLIALLDSAIVFAYWAVSEAWLGTTLGKAVVALRVMDLQGGRPGVKAALARAAVITVLFGMNLAQALDRLSGLRVLEVLVYLQMGLGIGFVAHALVAARRGTPLIHDRISATRVVRRAVAPASSSADPGPVAEPEPSPPAAAPPEPAPDARPIAGRRGFPLGVGIASLVVVFVLIALFADLWTGRVVSQSGMWTSGPYNHLPVIETLIADRLGVRSVVTSSTEVRWKTGEPTHHVGKLTVTLPWAAYTDERAIAAFHCVAETLTTNPASYDRLMISVEAKFSGVINSRKAREWSFAFDSSTGRWREAPPLTD